MTAVFHPHTALALHELSLGLFCLSPDGFYRRHGNEPCNLQPHHAQSISFSRASLIRTVLF